jgi:hypothetical protein
MLPPPHVWFVASTSPPPTFAEYAIVIVPFVKNADADIDACDGNGTVVVTEYGNVGLFTTTFPLGPAYVSDEIVPSPVCVAVYCTLIVPLDSSNVDGPIDNGGLHEVLPPGPVPDDPHPVATPTNATAATHSPTLERLIKMDGEGLM